jgi:AAA15 family ATPase/GTPase
MRIKEMTINGFKGIDYLKVEPRKINLIVGRNNTGKTSVLDAIDLLSSIEKIKRYSPYLPEIINVYSNESVLTFRLEEGDKLIKIRKPSIEEVIGEFRNTISKLLMYDIMHRIKEKSFDKDSIKKEIDSILKTTAIDDELVLELQKGSVTICLNGEERTYLSYDFKRIEVEKLQKLLTKISELVSNNIKEKFKVRIPVIMDFVYLQFFSRHMYRFPENKPKTIEDVIYIKDPLRIEIMSEPKGKEAVRVVEIDDYIKKHRLVENLKKFDFTTLIFDYDTNNPITIPYAFMGDGFKALVGLLWRISPKEIEDRVILIEEPETHMHPGYISELLKFIIKFSKDKNLQFFMTTHSIDFIEAFFDEELPQVEKEYLTEELLVLGMEKSKNHILPRLYNYTDAKLDREDLLIDLRG